MINRWRLVDYNVSAITNKEYVIPINVINGLPYITMRLHTDEEWSTLPHVLLTADRKWDPRVLDNAHHRRYWRLGIDLADWRLLNQANPQGWISTVTWASSLGMQRYGGLPPDALPLVMPETAIGWTPHDRRPFTSLCWAANSITFYITLLVFNIGSHLTKAIVGAVGRASSPQAGTLAYIALMRLQWAKVGNQLGNSAKKI